MYSACYDIDTKSIKFYRLFLPKIRTKLKTALDNLNELRQIMENDEVALNDTVSHFRHIPVYPGANKKLYDIPIRLRGVPKSESDAQRTLCQIILKHRDFQQTQWSWVRAQASMVYSYLEQRQIKYGHKIVKPIYDFNTFSGRSRTTGFNIQGSTDKYPIEHPLGSEYFVCLDWLAADIRMAGLLSGDARINRSFIDSDPYETLSKELSSENTTIGRSECKGEIIKSLYSLQFDRPVMKLYPALRAWVIKHVLKYKYQYDFKTVLGRPITKAKIKTSINAIIQGSVADAMQCVMLRLGSVNPDIIITEIHDSLILAGTRRNLKTVIYVGTKLMARPFHGILYRDLRFPVRVSVGRHWKQWKYLTTYRS